MNLPGYDQWKLATPPDYDWPPDLCEDCGCLFDEAGGCDCNLYLLEEPDPEEVAEMIDRAQEARTDG